MLDQETKRRIDSLRDILVGKVPDPKSQVEQITLSLIYKFMNDMDDDSMSMGGVASFFINDYEKYSWKNLFNTKLGGADLVNLYSEGITKMNQNPHLPQIFRDVFKNAYIPYRDPETLRLFLKTINDFQYTHSEKLGDAYEYLLSILGSQGDAGQFRTPRHIIDFIVEIVNPQKDETILDPACGTAGFLISAYNHILKNNTSRNIGDKLKPEERKQLTQNVTGYDIEPEMVRMSIVNMYLHNFTDPKIYEYDTLTSEDRWDEYYDIILANPPFMSPKGGIKPHRRFGVQANRSEVLFVDYIMEHLTPNGRAGIIVPEGVIFQTGTAYKQLRKKLITTSLIGVISLPAGVFQPYSGVKTSILILDKKINKKNKDVFFAKVDNEGFSLGSQRNEIEENDLPLILNFIKEDKENKNCFFVDKNKITSEESITFSSTKYLNTTGIVSKFDVVKITETFEVLSPKIKIKNKNFLEVGKIPIIDQSNKLIAGYWNDFKDKIEISKPVIIFGDHTRVIKYIDFDFVAGADGIKILLPKSNILPKYLFHIVKSLDIAGLGYSRHYKELKEKKIPLPPIETQNLIVEELDGYQKIIDGCRQVVENYKPIIDIDSSWEVVELGKIGEIVSGGTPSSSVKDYWDGDINWLTLVDLPANEAVNYISNSKRKITKLGLEKSSAKKIPKNSVIVSTRATIGRVGINKVDVTTNQGFKSIIIDENRFVPEFIAIQIYLIRDYLKSIAIGGTFGEISKSNFEKVKIPIPSIEIQKEIVQKIKEERTVINGNKKLIELYNQKIQDRINRIWGNVNN